MDDSGPDADSDGVGGDSPDGGGPDGATPGGWTETESTTTVAAPEPITESVITEINAPELFGGEEGEGGVKGTMWVLMGEKTQEPPSILTDMNSESGIDTPGYRGVTTIVFDGRVTGRNPYPKPWKFRVRRALQGWDITVPIPEIAIIGLGSTDPDDPEYMRIKAMNPAHIIYECATNRSWGRGLHPVFVDGDTFTLAAEKLYDEGFGLCLRWNRQDELSSFVQSVLDHIGAATYIDRRTGKLAIRLIRNDYNPANLPLYTKDNGILRIEEDGMPGNSGVVNEVIVNYVDPIKNAKRQFRVQNIASFQAVGSIFSETKDYPGIPTPELAARVAQRDLRAQGLPLKRYKVYMDRRGWSINPAEVMKVYNADTGVTSVLRVGKIDDNTNDNGEIVLTCLQDVFGFPATSFTAPQPGGYTPPEPGPAAPTVYAAFELNYRDVYRLLAGNLTGFVDTSGYGGLLVQRPSVATLSIALFTKTGSEVYYSRGNFQLTPTALTTAAISAGSSTITLASFTEWGRLAVNAAVRIDAEVCRLNAWDADAGTIVVSRGCADTIPQPHNTGARVWFADAGFCVDDRVYMESDVLSLRPCSTTATGVLDVSLAPTASLTFKNKASRPYPPGNVTVNLTRFDPIEPYTWVPTPKSWRVGEGTPYESGFELDYNDAVTAALALYNAANGGGWAVASGYPTVDGDTPLAVAFSKIGETDSPEYLFDLEPDFTPLTVEWAHRNKVTQGDTLIPHESASVSPEVGQAYTVRILDGSTVIRETTGITGTIYEYTRDEWETDGEYAEFDILLFSTLAGTQSQQAYRMPIVV